MTFYTLPEYEQWKENTNTRGWSIKYYKGLGTSTAKVHSWESACLALLWLASSPSPLLGRQRCTAQLSCLLRPPG